MIGLLIRIAIGLVVLWIIAIFCISYIAGEADRRTEEIIRKMNNEN